MFSYFHIPTKIIHGYESYTKLSELDDIIKKRIIMVTDNVLMQQGATQNLRRFIENVSAGLIFHAVDPDSGIQEDAVNLARESKVPVINAP